jgi:hypothetical protein
LPFLQPNSRILHRNTPYPSTGDSPAFPGESREYGTRRELGTRIQRRGLAPQGCATAPRPNQSPLQEMLTAENSELGTRKARRSASSFPNGLQSKSAEFAEKCRQSSTSQRARIHGATLTNLSPPNETPTAENSELRTRNPDLETRNIPRSAGHRRSRPSQLWVPMIVDRSP